MNLNQATMKPKELRIQKGKIRVDKGVENAPWEREVAYPREALHEYQMSLSELQEQEAPDQIKKENRNADSWPIWNQHLWSWDLEQLPESHEDRIESCWDGSHKGLLDFSASRDDDPLDLIFFYFEPMSLNEIQYFGPRCLVRGAHNEVNSIMLVEIVFLHDAQQLSRVASWAPDQTDAFFSIDEGNQPEKDKEDHIETSQAVEEEAKTTVQHLKQVLI